ncbi:MAG: AAA family ATPase [Planctomycetes bacterium]|nr:AAA family ATPase [Planctomycetota bacterium]
MTRLHAQPTRSIRRREHTDQASSLRALVSASREIIRPRSGAPARRARIISIASGKGGVGKTTIAVNLCIALAQTRTRVTLLDADLGMANADVMCGIMPLRRLERAVAGDGPVRGAQSLSELAIDAPGGFRLVPGAAGVARMAELSGEQRAVLIAGVAELAAGTDLVVIDTGAGLGRGVRSFLNIADQVLIIATPEPTSIADAYALIKCVLTRPGSELIEDRIGLSGRPARVPISLIVNQVAGVQEARKVHTRIASVCARFLSYPLPMAGWISQDVRVGRSVRARCPLLLNSPNCSAAKDLRRIAAEIGAARVREPARAGRLSALARWTGLGV